MKKSTRIFIFTAILLIGAFFSIAFVSQAFAEQMTVRLGYFGGPRPWIIGKALGMFEKGMGTKIEWVQFPSGAASITSHAAGEVDISRVGMSPLVAAIFRGVGINQIAVAGAIATSERLVARKSIPDVKSLEGKKIAYPPGSTAHYALMAALKVHKVNIAKTSVVGLKPAEMLAAWKRGDIDAAYVWGPFSHQMESENGHELIATKDLRKDGYYIWNTYSVRTEFAAKNPELVVKFLQVFQETVKLYKSDPDKYAKIIADHLEQPLEAVKDTLKGLEYPPFEEQLKLEWLGDSKTTGNSKITKSMSDVASFLVELGDVRKDNVPKSFDQFNNMRFMEEVVKKK